ncbi:hypothetical protein Tco_0079262 [Tanacetum coccineum]
MPEVKVEEKFAMVSSKVTPQLLKLKIKIEEKIVKAEVVDEHIVQIQDLQSYKEHDEKISTLLFGTRNKVGALKTCEEIMGFNDDEDVKGFRVDVKRKSIEDKVRCEVFDVVEALDIENSRESSFQMRGFMLSKPRSMRFRIGLHLRHCPRLAGIKKESALKTELENKTLATLVASPKDFEAERKETGVSHALVMKGVNDVMENAIPVTTLLVFIRSEVLGFDSIKGLYVIDEYFVNMWMELETKQHQEEQHLVVPCSDEEFVKFPTQPATTEIIGDNGINLENFFIVLTREEADIIRPIMAVEDEPLMML